MAKAKKKANSTNSNLDHEYAPPVNVRDFINSDFMGMKPKAIDELDAKCEETFRESEANLAAAELLKNDAYLTADVVATVGGENGGEN